MFLHALCGNNWDLLVKATLSRDVCLDAEQNIDHFEIHLMKFLNAGKDHVCMGTLCDPILTDYTTTE